MSGYEPGGARCGGGGDLNWNQFGGVCGRWERKVSAVMLAVVSGQIKRVMILIKALIFIQSPVLYSVKILLESKINKRIIR